MEYPGIYIIYNLKTDQCYIGQSLRVKERIRHHKYQLRHNKHFNSYLQKSWNKHGEEFFIFTIHCSVICSLKKDVLNALNTMESQLIKQYKSFNKKYGYNHTTGGENCEVCEETIKKLSKAHKGKKKSPLSESTRKKISLIHQGMKHSEETLKKMRGRILPQEQIEKMRRTKTGKKIGPASEERKRKIGEAQKGGLNHNFGKPIPDLVKQKIRASNQGSKCYLAKLTEENVSDIKKRLSLGEKGVDLAREYEVATTQISSIKHGKTWRHVK